MDGGKIDETAFLIQFRESTLQCDRDSYIEFVSQYIKNENGGLNDIGDQSTKEYEVFESLRKNRSYGLYEKTTVLAFNTELKYIKEQLGRRCRITAHIENQLETAVCILEDLSKNNEVSSKIRDKNIRVGEVVKKKSQYHYYDSVFPRIEDMVRFAAYEETEINATITFAADERYTNELVANVKGVHQEEKADAGQVFFRGLCGALTKAVALCALEKLGETALRSAGYNVPSVPLLILIPASIIAACLIEGYRNSAVKRAEIILE